MNQFQEYSQTGAGIPFSAMRKKSKGKSKSKSVSFNLKQKKRKSKTRRTSVKRSWRRLKRKTKRKKAKAKRKTKRDKTCQCGSNTYTGLEDSPKGLGKCGECIPLNVMLKGKDGTLYENKKEGWVKA